MSEETKTGEADNDDDDDGIVGVTRTDQKLTDEAFGDQCAALQNKLAEVISGEFHPDVTNTVLSRAIAMTVSLNAHCMGCADITLFDISSTIRRMVAAEWEHWQTKRAEIIGERFQAEQGKAVH